MSTLKVDTLQTTGGAGLYPAKAWVNFNGTGTVAIRADGNVSSITDNGTGKYSTNFSTSIEDVNFAAMLSNNGSSDSFANTRLFSAVRTRQTNKVDSQYLGDGGSEFDTSYISVSVTR